MTQPGCLNCGGNTFEQGYVTDAQQGTVKWFDGPLDVGPMGNPRRAGRDRHNIQGVRCMSCGRLEMFVLK